MTETKTLIQWRVESVSGAEHAFDSEQLHHTLPKKPNRPNIVPNRVFQKELLMIRVCHMLDQLGLVSLVN